MPHVDLATPAARMHSSLEDLQAAWIDTQEKWNDQNRRKFEEDHLMPLAMTIKLSMDAAGRMGEILFEAERTCADERSAE